MARFNRATPMARLAGGVAILALAALAAVVFVRDTFASPPVNATITDPDGDDQFNGEIKTRNNTDGSLRARAEVEISPVDPGRQYRISIMVTEFTLDGQVTEIAEATTPLLTPQPPR